MFQISLLLFHRYSNNEWGKRVEFQIIRLITVIRSIFVIYEYPNGVITSLHVIALKRI